MSNTDSLSKIKSALDALNTDINLQGGVKSTVIKNLTAALTTACEALQQANRKLDEIAETLDHQNMSVNGWHLNGDTERLDKFFESNDWYSEPKVLAQIANLLCNNGADGEEL